MWKHRVLWILITMVQIAPAACDDAASDPIARAGSLTGSVTRHKTGTGVQGIVAVLIEDGRVVGTAHTDDAGIFDLGAVDPGSYTVQLTGFDIAGIDTRFDAIEPTSADVTIDGGTRDLVFTVVALVPPRITGEVFCNDAPVEGAQVRVIGGNADVMAVTNTQGKYGALDLPPGHYAVFPVNPPCALSPVYQAIELKPGQSGEADFRG